MKMHQSVSQEGVTAMCEWERSDNRDRVPHYGSDVIRLLEEQFNEGRAIEAFLDLRQLMSMEFDPTSPLVPLYRESIWRGISHALSNCDWTHYDLLARALRNAIAEDPDFWMVGETTLALTGLSQFHLLEVNRRYCRRYEAEPALFVHTPPQGPLRIGVIGCDFAAQSTAYLFTGVVEAMDRDRFHLTAYDFSEAAQDTPWRRRCVSAYDRFVSIAGMSDGEAARRIQADGIDVLIHMRDIPHGRLGICAHRPAGVQIQYLYFPGTSGAAWMDYLVADEVVVPPEHEDGYAETILRLPGCYQPNDSLRAEPAQRTRETFGFGPDTRILANFSQAYKMSPDMFDVWCALLRADPARVLWLLDGGDVVCENLRREAAARGVDPARLVFSPEMPIQDHLARLACADIVVDAHPCGGHTLTSDALWAGTPVVSLKGETFASRVPASLLASCGVPDLAVATSEAYFAIADALLRDPRALGAMKQTISRARKPGGLFDSFAYAQKFGSALEQVVRSKWETGSPDRPGLSPQRDET